jgi:gluconokinase
MIGVIILMGISGSGKSTVGALAAQRLGWKFLDGDDYHPQANIEKMRNGTPLTDEDRAPWLERIHQVILEQLASHTPTIIACSALKEAYRKILIKNLNDIAFVHLQISYETVLSRLQQRKGHFFPKDLVTSQLSTLETPHHVIMLDANQPLEKVTDLLSQSVKELIGSTG